MWTSVYLYVCHLVMPNKSEFWVLTPRQQITSHMEMCPPLLYLCVHFNSPLYAPSLSFQGAQCVYLCKHPICLSAFLNVSCSCPDPDQVHWTRFSPLQADRNPRWKRKLNIAGYCSLELGNYYRQMYKLQTIRALHDTLQDSGPLQPFWLARLDICYIYAGNIKT